MATSDNTSSDSPRPQVPTYPSPIPGDQQRLNWPDYLLAMSLVVEQIAPGEPGRFVGQCLTGLSRQARMMGCEGPAQHIERVTADADRQAAYIASLEQAAECGGTWALGPDPDLGGWGAHPDERTLQAFIAIDPQDETYRN